MIRFNLCRLRTHARSQPPAPFNPERVGLLRLLFICVHIWHTLQNVKASAWKYFGSFSFTGSSATAVSMSFTCTCLTVIIHLQSLRKLCLRSLLIPYFQDDLYGRKPNTFLFMALINHPPPMTSSGVVVGDVTPVRGDPYCCSKLATIPQCLTAFFFFSF